MKLPNGKTPATGCVKSRKNRRSIFVKIQR